MAQTNFGIQYSKYSKVEIFKEIILQRNVFVTVHKKFFQMLLSFTHFSKKSGGCYFVEKSIISNSVVEILLRTLENNT